MKAPIALVLVTLCPVLSPAEVSGTWEGALKFPAETLRIVLHITGDDNDLHATNDSPDQNIWGRKVDSIKLADHVLTFEIRLLDYSFTGDLIADGTIVGTFTVHGAGFPLVLARSAGVPRPQQDTTSTTIDGRYRNNWTGIEFDVPPGFVVTETETRSNPVGLQADLDGTDMHIRGARVAVWMNKRRVGAAAISSELAAEIPAKVQRRSGPGSPYTIPERDIQKLQIGGQQAIRATAYFSTSGRKMVELLAWINTEHSIAHFYAIVPADEVDRLKTAFDQMVMSARVP